MEGAWDGIVWGGEWEEMGGGDKLSFPFFKKPGRSRVIGFNKI